MRGPHARHPRRAHDVRHEVRQLGLGLKRAQTRMEEARKVAATGAISGAVARTPASTVRRAVRVRAPGLAADPLSTQVLARDRHAQVMAGLAVTLPHWSPSPCRCACCSSPTSSSRGAVREGAEGEQRHAAQAQPHHGRARLRPGPHGQEQRAGGLRQRGAVVRARHQHSGAERVALADSFIALDYMFGKMQWMLDGLQTYPAKMEHNLWRTKGLIFSSKVLLAWWTPASAARTLRHRATQRHEGVGGYPERRGRTHLSRKPRSRPRGEPQRRVLDEIFDPWDFLTRKDVVFDRLKELEF